MNGRRLTDAQISKALRAHLPDRAYPGLRERVLDAATSTGQRRALPSFIGALGEADPLVRRRALLIAAALLVSLALASVAAVGALRLFQADPVDDLALEPRPSLPIVAPSSTPSQPSAVPTASQVTNPAGIWISTGTLGTPRSEHTAVRLLDGRVLVLGGSNTESDAASPELYDPATGTWSATGEMLRPLGGFPATLLRDGRVLVGDSLGEDQIGAELYDPASGAWSDTGMPIAGAGHPADAVTLLVDGKVLVAGLDGAELYDPDSGTWSATGEMTTPRYYATATLLPDGRVLAAGGYVVPDVMTDAAELYDPNSGSWTAIANMHARHGHHTATLLRDGKVLVASSSFDTAGRSQLEAEVYDPATGTWTALPVRPGITVGTATMLADGRVLVADPFPDSVAAELYDPDTGSWSAAAPMLRSHGTQATLLLDGTVLVAGGRDCREGMCVATGSAELYVPAGVAPPPLPAFPPPPPPVFPSPTPRPTPLPPAAGPVPPNGRSWTVTVDNRSSDAAALFVADEDGDGLRLVGAATPNVVPAGASVKVTFLFPPDGGWIYVNPRPGEGGSLVSADDIGIPGKIVVTADGQVGWLSP